VAPAASSIVELDGWRCETVETMGFRVVRSIVARKHNLHVVLSVGELADGGPTRFNVSERVLRFLLKGELP
jgi:hypothetical protein